ncbi:MAG: class I SAM-dependent methyltransferase [Mastigocoleus sp.]
MFEKQPQNIRDTVKVLAEKSLAQSDPTGWFETLYSQANQDTGQVPWANLKIHPYLQDWLDKSSLNTQNKSTKSTKSTLVVGCGLGDDAEALQKLGLQVTAFDISPTAINWCKQRFPDSQVNYQVADLFNLPPEWNQAFDLVIEIRNIQALPLNVRTEAIELVASLVASKGKLVVITRFRNTDAEPEGPPWALSEKELAQFQEFGLKEMGSQRFTEGDSQEVTKLWIEYSRD